jgi:TRAP-type uncharacterized transport system substrate-binding protein
MRRAIASRGARLYLRLPSIVCDCFVHRAGSNIKKTRTVVTARDEGDPSARAGAGLPTWGHCVAASDAVEVRKAVAHPRTIVAPPPNILCIVLALLSLLLVGQGAFGQSPQPNPTVAQVRRTASSTIEDQWRAKLNGNTMAIIAGRPGETYIEIAHDLAVVLNDDHLRVLPIAGLGGAQNIRDVLYLRGVDAGITSTHMLRYFASTGELSAALDRRLAYITKLFVEEMHVVAGPGIAGLDDLNGKKVNFSDVGSSTQITARDVFGLLSIQVEEVNINQADAIAKVKSREIAATVLFSGKPVSLFAHIPDGDNLHLLSVPFTPTLENTYSPGSLEAEAYPNLIAQGHSVQTVAVDAVLITNNWPRNSERYRRIATFVDAFFLRLPDFRTAPRHPKWLEVNLAADLPGWDRFPAAQEWLERSKEAGSAPLQAQFEQFLAQTRRPDAPALSEVEKQRLFREFLGWSARQSQSQSR